MDAPPDDEPQLPPPGPEWGGWFRRLTFFGLLAGLCPLIPLPMADDWILGRVRLRMTREILAGAGLGAAPAELRRLAGIRERRLAGGCLSMFLVPLLKLLLYLLRKVVRKIVLILTLKECADRCSEVIHEGYLLHRAAARGDLGKEGAVAPQDAAKMRAALERAAARVDPRPINQLVKASLRGSRWLLLEASRRLARVFRGPPQEEAAMEADLAGEERLLSSLINRIAASLWLQQSYWEELFRHYSRAYAEAPAEPS